MYCKNCGRWNDAERLRQGNGVCAVCGAPLEEEKKDNKTIYIVLAVIIVLLLLLVILLMIKLLQKKNGQTSDPNTVATSIAEKEEAFRSAIHVVDASAYPDCSESGYIETYVGDLTGDNEPEYLAFYGDFGNEDSPTVDVHLYDFDEETCTAVKVDEIDDAFDVKPRNGSVFLCIYIDDGDLCVRRAGYGNGGSMWYTRDMRFSVENGELTLVYDFDEYVNNGVNNIYHFTENVSGETYNEPDEIGRAREARGVYEHTHGVNDRSFFPENHILVLYRNSNFDEAGETGYLLLRFLQEGLRPADTTEAAATTEATTEQTTAAPTTAATTTEAQTAAPASVDTASVWSQLDGYWGCPTDKNSFLYFKIENGEYVVIRGYYASDMFYIGNPRGEITKNADGTVNVPVYVPAMMGEFGYDAFSTTYKIDLSGIPSGTITVTTEDGTQRFEYIGTDEGDINRFKQKYWDNL